MCLLLLLAHGCCCRMLLAICAHVGACCFLDPSCWLCWPMGGLWFGVWGISGLWFVVCCERLGAIWAHLRAMLAYGWPILGLCWPFEGNLGPGLCWPILGLCWPSLGLCWPILDPS